MGKNVVITSNPSSLAKESFIYSPSTLSLIQEKILSIPKKTNPIVISLAGGSGVGKSTLSKFIQSFLCEKATILEQDNFQLGEDFKYKETSPYRWDDPRNFDLSGYEMALKSLKNNNPIQTPIFSLKKNKRTNIQYSQPNTFIICEGLYTLDNRLLKYIDFSIYLEASFYARFLRRIFRFTEESKINLPEVPVKHMLIPTHKAHIDFITLQKKSADIVVKIPYTFDETYKKFNLEKKDLSMPKGNIICEYRSNDSLSILGLVDKMNTSWLLIIRDDKVIYKAKITNDLLFALQKINFEEN